MSAIQVRDRHDGAGLTPAARRFLAAHPQLETPFLVLAGPSCDSAGVLYEKSGYQLPVGLRIGDRLQLMSAGAYTASYSTVWFNGFEPLRTFFVSATTPVTRVSSARSPLFPDDIDDSDPWQFRNVLVH